MTLDLHALSTRGATVTIPVYEDELNVTYDPTVWTVDFRDEYTNSLREASRLRQLEALKETAAIASAELESGDITSDEHTDRILNAIDLAARRGPSLKERNAPLAQGLAKIVKEWDLVNKGKPVAIRADSIQKHVPGELQVAIWNGIVEDIQSLGNPSSSRNGSNPGGS